MLFEKNHFGKPISEKLSNYLKKHTTRIDRISVSTYSEVSASTIRDVMYRHIPLTENNSKAILELMRVAVKNCTFSIENTNVAKQELETMLEKK